jgi:signal transduction histidine kinase
MTACDWLEPELPAHAAGISARGRQTLLTRARRDLLHRTYTGTFAYPIFAVVVGWIVGLTDEYPRHVAAVALLLAIIVVVRVFLYRHAIAHTERRTWTGRTHILLGITSAVVFATAIGCAYVARAADSSVTAGYVVMAGIAGTVVMIAGTHRRLAQVWVMASILPGMVVFVIEGSTTAHMMLAMYVLYLPILRKMIDKGHEAYWDAQVNAVRLDEQTCEHVRLSRLAGMAENATNVLHDVGNSLNAVKTSATCLAREEPSHPSHDLTRFLGLVAPHAHDLAAFFSSDPRGPKVYPFLEAMTRSSVGHADATMAELARLRSHVDHIEAIVRRQQEIAKGVGEAESCGAADLVGLALGMSRVAHRAATVEVGSDIEPGLRVVVDRHRIVQVLVNLLENAVDATADAHRPRIEIRARIDGASAVIEVIDNGSGIPEAVAARIFSRGFTTKAHGHGFGLHGSFSIAQAMGGELSFESAGLGAGATFRLRLPADRSVQPAEPQLRAVG